MNIWIGGAAVHTLGVVMTIIVKRTYAVHDFIRIGACSIKEYGHTFPRSLQFCMCVDARLPRVKLCEYLAIVIRPACESES